MMSTRVRASHVIFGIGAAALAICLPALRVQANPPPPANDTPATAEVIGPAVPDIAYGHNVLADNTVSATAAPAPVLDVDGPDVYYSFTPGATGSYRFQLIPWQRAPLRSSERRFAIYVRNGAAFINAILAPGDARAVHLDVTLTSGTTYTIGVDINAATQDEFDFTLIVDTLPTVAPDTCATAADLPSALPAIALANIDGAAANFAFAQSADQCAVSGTTPNTAPGNDHVYHFVPSADDHYAIDLVNSGTTTFNGVIYVDDSCPPFFPDGCMGASDHSTSGSNGGRHEFVVAFLEAGKDYWIYVDNGNTPPTTQVGGYALVVDTAAAYEVNEVEPNNTAATASSLDTPFNGGQLVGPADEDWWAVPGSTGDRVYAWVNNGGSSNSTLDTDLGFFAANGTTLIEFDDEDGDGADAPIGDLRFIYSTTAPVIAGAKMTSNGTHYWRVTDTTATGTVHRYRFHVGVEPATRAPLAECEPNDTVASADRSGKHYYAGVIDVNTDVDIYAFEAAIGDRVFVAADGDPERDSTGADAANTDPNAFHPLLVIRDPAGDVLISDISDSNSAQSPPDYPAQGGFFVARSTGTHYVEVRPQSSLSQVGPTETYELAIFLNDAAPALAEEVDPIVNATTNTALDNVAVTATDNAGGDSGICAVEILDVNNVTLAGLSFTPGDPSVSFTVELVNPAVNGSGKLLVTDCAGNTACASIAIDVTDPACTGFNFSNRSPRSMHGPIHVPDNQPLTGIEGTIDVLHAGTIIDVNVTFSTESTSAGDIDAFLISPQGTIVELVTDRASSLAHDITDATFDDSAATIMTITSGDEPWTGTWLPEGAGGLAVLNGQNALGTWRLNIRDDSSSENGGSRLVRWSLDIDAGFAGPESFDGTATDNVGAGAGVQSVVLTNAVNTQIDVAPFNPGDPVVPYTVSLIDPLQNGSGTVVVTDLSDNTCEEVITLNGLPDASPPNSSGAATTDLTFSQEVQLDVPSPDPAGVTATINVPDTMLVGEVEASITIDTEDLGRLAATLSHGGEFASLVNRVGMDERFSVGLTKNTIEISLDDDAPVADDAHLEPASGAIEFLGLHQPDGRGEFVGNGIDTDDRDNMLFFLAGQSASGDWDLFVGDFRAQGTTQSEFRRWSMTLKNPCGPERYVGTAKDIAPGAGICSIALQAGATNLAVSATFTAGDEIVDYRVELVDPSQPGSGTVEILDCEGNATLVPVSLEASSGDNNLPVVTGAVNQATFEFGGSATDIASGDTGVAAVEMAPWSDNLQIVSVTPAPPAGSVDFVVGLVNAAANGRGYVRVTDGCGLRAHILVEIDAVGPVCTGSAGRTKRYLSGVDLPQNLPDNSPAGVSSNIIVPDIDVISDVNITFNITHGFAADIDMFLTSPIALGLISDNRSTDNDFIDVTLDDEAASVMATGSLGVQVTGSWRPEDGLLSTLDGSPASGTYTLRVADDKANDFGSFDNWSLTIESGTFPMRYDGRAEDGETHGSGICTIELVSGVNVTLTVDPFIAGDAIVRYSVSLTNPAESGKGVVRVTDCAGNTCEVFVVLAAGGAEDCNSNGIPDELDLSQGTSADCNTNGTPDECDIAGGFSLDANSNGTPDECDPPAATLVGASSRKNHGPQGDQDIAINLAGDVEDDPTSVSTEPRSAGITELRLAFDVPPGAAPGPNPVTILVQNCGGPCPCNPGSQAAYAPSGISPSGVLITGNELVLSFSPGLNGSTYRVEVGPTVTSIAGQVFEVRGLVGDVNGDAWVNGLDRSVALSVWTGSGFTVRSDVVHNGVTDGADRSAVIAAWTGPDACAP